jgi:peptidoglycan/LPS O-acetylase OafA/YrhL
MNFVTTDQTINLETNTRFHYLDNVRAWAMIVGVIFHASLAYSPLIHNFWLTAETQQSELVDIIAWFSHLFRMSVFFVISGFFAHLLLKKRGLKGMLKNRIARILIPFLVFLPLLWTAMGICITYAIKNVENPSPILNLIIGASKMPTPPPPPAPTTMHLWFLYQLLWFFGAIIILYRLKITDFVASLMNKYTLSFVAFFPLLLVPAFFSQDMPHSAPESFVPQLWSFGLYGWFFLVGFAWYGNQDFLTKIESYGWIFLGLGVILYAFLYPIFPKTISFIGSAKLDLNIKILGAILEAYISVMMTFATLILGKKYLNQNSVTMRYFADASYWIYIIHLPLLFFIQFYLLDVKWNMWVELMLSIVLTLSIGMLSYFLLVRWTFIGRMLNGKRRSV